MPLRAHDSITHSMIRRACLWAGAVSAAFLMTVPGRVTAQPSPAIDEPYLASIPTSCEYLTENLATGLLRADVTTSAATEHIPALQRSTCIYTAQRVSPRREVGFAFRFMIWDLFDTALPMVALEFNAGFAAGGISPVQVEDLGKLSFVFEDTRLGRTTLMMVTGIQGAPDFAGRPSEFVATYHYQDPEVPHAARLEELLRLARGHLDEWLAEAQSPSQP